MLARIRKLSVKVAEGSNPKLFSRDAKFEFCRGWQSQRIENLSSHRRSSPGNGGREASSRELGDGRCFGSLTVWFFTKLRGDRSWLFRAGWRQMRGFDSGERREHQRFGTESAVREENARIVIVNVRPTKVSLSIVKRSTLRFDSARKLRERDGIRRDVDTCESIEGKYSSSEKHLEPKRAYDRKSVRGARR